MATHPLYKLRPSHPIVSYLRYINEMSTTAETAPLLQKNDAPVPSPIPKWKQYYKLTRLHLWPAGAILFFWPCSRSRSSPHNAAA